MMKGTVIGPVVTPPESKASGRNDCPPVAMISADRAKRNM